MIDAVSRTEQGRQIEPSVKTLRSPILEALRVEWWNSMLRFALTPWLRIYNWTKIMNLNPCYGCHMCFTLYLFFTVFFLPKLMTFVPIYTMTFSHTFVIRYKRIIFFQQLVPKRIHVFVMANAYGAALWMYLRVDLEVLRSSLYHTFCMGIRNWRTESTVWIPILIYIRSILLLNL